MDTRPTDNTCKSLRLRACERLDLSDCRRFLRAARLLRGSQLDHVVIDLMATRQVPNSGLTLLLLLLGHAGDRVDRVTLVNCAPAVYRRLRQARIPISFCCEAIG
jgi:anti-anti-sigma regulatory factor